MAGLAATEYTTLGLGFGAGTKMYLIGVGEGGGGDGDRGEGDAGTKYFRGDRVGAGREGGEGTAAQLRSVLFKNIEIAIIRDIDRSLNLLVRMYL